MSLTTFTSPTTEPINEAAMVLVARLAARALRDQFFVQDHGRWLDKDFDVDSNRRTVEPSLMEEAVEAAVRQALT